MSGVNTGETDRPGNIGGSGRGTNRTIKVVESIIKQREKNTY